MLTPRRVQISQLPRRCDSHLDSVAKFVDEPGHGPLRPLSGWMFDIPKPDRATEKSVSQSDGGAASSACPMSIRPSSFTNTARDTLGMAKIVARIHATYSLFRRDPHRAEWILHARRSEPEERPGGDEDQHSSAARPPVRRRSFHRLFSLSLPLSERRRRRRRH